MARLVKEMGTQEFLEAHPALQAAYAHYAFVCIHPFADGNGRVARALASLFTVRDCSLPLLITSDHRSEYIDALELADSGDAHRFVEFIMERGIDAARLSVTSVKAALSPQLPSEAERLRRLFQTRAGISIQDIDKASQALVDLFIVTCRETAGAIPNPFFSFAAEKRNGGQPTTPSYRRPVDGFGFVNLSMVARPPANSSVRRDIGVELPRDPSLEDDVVLRPPQNGLEFAARVAEIYPAITIGCNLRLKIFSEQVLGDMTSELSASAKAALQNKGY
jgi:hypothetical protein